MKANHAWQWMIALTLGWPGLPAWSLTIDEALAKAMANNPSLHAAVHRVEAASAAIEAARAGYYPTITLSAGYTRTDNPPQAFFMNLNQRTASLQNDFNHPDDTSNYRGSVAFKLLLLDGGQRGLTTRMAESGEQAAAAMREAARNELAYQVIRAFHSVHQADALMTVRRDSVANVEEHMRVASERFEAGSALKSDLLHLEVQLAEAREQLIRADNGRRLAIAALAIAIGDDHITDELSLAGVSDPTDAPVTDVDPSVAARRPEFMAATLRAQAAELDSLRMRRNRLPRLSAFGSMDYDSDTVRDFDDSYLVGALAEVDLFTGFQRKAEIAAAEARKREAAATTASVLDQLHLDLLQSQLLARESRERWLVARQSVGSADEALRITRERYNEGAAEITELLTAHVNQTATRSRAVAARHDYLIALANLQRSTGHFAKPLQSGE